MNALWRLGQATVRDIHASLAATRPRAYTTIMTILDRLAQKGVVEQREAQAAPGVYKAPSFGGPGSHPCRYAARGRILPGIYRGRLASHLSSLQQFVTQANVRRAGKRSKIQAGELETTDTTRPSAGVA